MIEVRVHLEVKLPESFEELNANLRVIVILDCLLHQPRLITVGCVKRSTDLLRHAVLDVDCDEPVIPPL